MKVHLFRSAYPGGDHLLWQSWCGRSLPHTTESAGGQGIDETTCFPCLRARLGSALWRSKNETEVAYKADTRLLLLERRRDRRRKA